MRLLIPISWSLFALLALSCGSGKSKTFRAHAAPRQVSIQVEVYDPASGYVWENVGVRILEGEMEWSSCTCENPDPYWFLTDAAGTVFLSSKRLATAEIGFQEDFYGRAVLGGGTHEDEAWVWLEISAEGFVPVLVEVPVSFDEPEVFVQVPFK